MIRKCNERSVNMSKVAAIVQLGYFTSFYEDDDACGIVSQIEKNQDFDCLIRMGYANETGKKGQAEVKKLESFVKKYRNEELSLEDIEKLNVHFSIGDIKCHGVARTDEEIEALKAKA